MYRLPAARGVLALRPRVQPVVHSRAFWNVSLPVLSGPGGAHITKYHIVKPGKEGVEWDDFLLALPERDQLATFSKEVPLFIRYLKVVTDQEGRSEDFVQFLERAKSGLVVENDVFISTEEMLALMWKNGYSEQERNSIQFTFPSDYKFHYPELSVLFNLSEEDTYKFCMRTRIESSHIGELDWAKVKRKGFIRDHWLIFGTGLLTFKYFPFFNYYFGIKVFGTSMVCVTFWTILNRFVANISRRNEYMAAQKTAQDVMHGEDKILLAMSRFANDAKSVEHLQGFKTDVEVQIGSYKQALLEKMKADLTERAVKQLQLISVFEAGMGSALQQLVVQEAASSFRAQFPGDVRMKELAFSGAVKALAGETLTVSDDPVASHFRDAFDGLSGVDLSSVKVDPIGSLAERVAFAQQQKEAEFAQSFMVTSKEAAEVKQIVGSGDISSLSVPDAERLETLFTSINGKVGYSLPLTLDTKPIGDTSDAAANAYISKVNAQLDLVNDNLRAARLKAFAQAFA